MAYAYTYRAALYCSDCAESIKSQLEGEAGCDRALMETGIDDSELYPQGPYSNGGGEADCPQHCDSCWEFLENTLTDDGLEYVRKAIARGTGKADVLRTWQNFYGPA